MKKTTQTTLRIQMIPFIFGLCFLYMAYILLLIDNPLNTSISNIIDTAHQFTGDYHVVILGLLPLYISLMVFGAAGLGIYLGSKIKAYLNRT